MKKFLVIVIFLIPIIVVFALSATSTILSLATPDNPTDIQIRDSFNKVVDRDAVIDLDFKSEDEYIMVDVLPLMTKEDGINEPEADENNTGEVKLVQILGTNKYQILPIKIGIATIIISAKANVNVRRSVTFHVKSESLESISVYSSSINFGQENEDLQEVVITEIPKDGYFEIDDSTALFADIYPIDALKESQVYWKVVDGNSVTITPNGKVHIVDRGLTQVRVSARDKNLNYIVNDIIIDTRKAIVKSKNAISEEETIDELWIRENVVLDNDNSVVSALGDRLFRVNHIDPSSLEESFVDVYVALIEEEEWDFVDRFSRIYTNNGPYFLSVEYLVNKESIEDVKYESSNSDIAEIDDDYNTIIPKSAGRVKIYATIDAVTKEMDILVRERVPSISLEYGSEHAKLGIQLTRKWGTNWLNENNEIIHEMRFALSDKANKFDVIWESTDEYAISIERIIDSQDIILNFSPENCLGKSITISAFLNINGRKYRYIKSSFTFNMLETDDYVNVTDFSEIMYLNFEEIYNICLQGDISAPETVNYNRGVSFYGNGFLYDSSFVSDEDFNHIFVGAINIFRDPWDWHGSNLKIPEGKELQNFIGYERPLTFEEIRFENSNSIEESNMRGAAVFIYSFSADDLITFRYVQTKNGEYGIAMKRVKNVLIEGCILGDSATYSLYSEWASEEETSFYGSSIKPKMVIRNCVFKHSDGPAVAFLYNSDIDPESLEYNYLPELRIEGFMDVYNWHNPDSFTNMFSKIIIRVLSDVYGMDERSAETIRKMLNSAFADYFKVKELERLYYTYQNKKYVSVGLLAMGAIFKPSIEKITCEDPRLRVDQIVMEDESGAPLTPIIAGLEMLVKRFVNVGKITNPSPFVIYDSNGRDPAIMPGEPVPQSYELYSRLTGVSEDLYIQG